MNDRVADWDPAQYMDVDQRMAQMSEMRAKCPVGFTSTRADHWTVSRYKDLVAVAGDATTFSNGGDPRFGRPLPPLEVDPPEHALFRQALQRFWLPSRMRLLEPRVTHSVDLLLAPLLERGEADLAREFAYPLPVLALCAQLDIDDEHWEEIKTLGEQQLGVESTDPEEQALAREAHGTLMARADAIVADRHANPRSPENDITSTFLSMEVDGAPIDDALVAGMLRLLISAGHNSTTNALGNSFLYLARNPDAQQKLRDDPKLIPLAVEEMLRFESPVQEMFRWATRDVELQGRTIAQGDRVGLLWGSANRDEEVFPDADRCVLDRRPNRHLTFGYGIHTCIGAPMARMELRVAITTVLARTKKFELAGEVVRKPFHHMGVSKLPVRFIFE